MYWQYTCQLHDTLHVVNLERIIPNPFRNENWLQCKISAKYFSPCMWLNVYEDLYCYVGSQISSSSIYHNTVNTNHIQIHGNLTGDTIFDVSQSHSRGFIYILCWWCCDKKILSVVRLFPTCGHRGYDRVSWSHTIWMECKHRK